MLSTKEPVLRISTKIEALHRLFSQRDVESLIDELDVNEVVELQFFMWEKTVEFGLKAKGKDFSRRDVTKRMLPTPDYQQMKGCSEPSFICKGTQCIHSNPVCAIEKIKGHIKAMSAAICEYVGLEVEELELITE